MQEMDINVSKAINCHRCCEIRKLLHVSFLVTPGEFCKPVVGEALGFGAVKGRGLVVVQEGEKAREGR